MNRRPVPGTDLSLSVVGLGCWAIGGKWWGEDIRDEDSAHTIHAALDAGINWFDTAPLYGYGHADEVLRDALSTRQEEIVVATKVGVRWTAATDHAESYLAPEYIVEDTEASLRRLGLECIDLLQVHWPCEHQTPLEATLDALEGLRERGKIRWYGLCNYGSEEILQARKRPGMAVLQTPFSMLRRELEGDLRDSCTQGPEPIGILAYEPLCRGLLTGKFTSQPRFPDTDLRAWDDRFQGARFQHALGLVGDLQQVADKVGVPLAALAAGWVLQQEGLTCAIVGAKRPSQIQDNALAATLLGREKLWSVVDRILAMHGGWAKGDEQ